MFFSFLFSRSLTNTNSFFFPPSWYGIGHQDKVSNVHKFTKKQTLKFVADIMKEESAIAKPQGGKSLTPANTTGSMCCFWVLSTYHDKKRFNLFLFTEKPSTGSSKRQRRSADPAIQSSSEGSDDDSFS
jgi:hypothetical protein